MSNLRYNFNKSLTINGFHFSFQMVDNVYGFIIIKILRAPNLDSARSNPHTFHILEDYVYGPHICWSDPIQSFEAANAIMLTWAKMYVTNLGYKSRYRESGHIPNGVFRASLFRYSQTVYFRSHTTKKTGSKPKHRSHGPVKLPRGSFR